MLARFVVSLLLCGIALGPTAVAVEAQSSTNPLQFVPLPTPCRAVDTRLTGGPIAAGTSQTFNPAGGGCNIPGQGSGPIAYALNVTVVPRGALGFLTVWPTGGPQPLVSTLNSDGRVKANAAIIGGGTDGMVSVYASDTTDLILDVSGYFVPATTNYVYVPITPCRVVDTRIENGTNFGAPSLVAGQQRTFELANSSCNLPASVFTNGGGLAFNVTAVPIGGHPVSYVTVWGTSPTEPQTPSNSTLNGPTGTIVANAALIAINPSTSGSVSVFATDNTDLVLDVFGYFTPASQDPAGLSLYTLSPCRVLDTRESSGEFQGQLKVPVSTGNNCNVPGNAQAYALNATVVPAGPLDFLTLWPDTTSQPLVSTLNAIDNVVTSNMAIVSSSNGSIDAFASSTTQLILDVSSYFAPAPSFTLSTRGVDENSFMIEPGSTVPFTLTASPVNGFTGNVQTTLTASTGLTVTPSTVTLVPGVAQAIAVTASPGAISTKGFDSTVSIQATSGSITQTLTEAVEIAPNFSIEYPVPGVLSLGGGSVAGSFIVAPAPLFDDTVTAQLTGLPPGLTVGTSGFGSPFPMSFSPATSVTLYSRCPGNGGAGFPCEADLFWLAYDGVAPGTYPLTLTATSGTTVHTESLTLVVSTPPFSLSASPTNLTIPQGGTQSVTLIPSGYGVGTSTIYDTLGNLPSGVTASQTTNSNGSITITLTPGASVTPGTYVVTATISENIYVSGYTNAAASPSASAQFTLTIGPAASVVKSKHQR